MNILRKSLKILLPLMLVLSFSACDVLEEEGIIEPAQTGLQASGTIEAVDVVIASEISGKVKEVFVQEGEDIQAGDPLFSLEDESLTLQREQVEAEISAANASLESMQAGLEAAKENLAYIQTQYDLTLQVARQADQPERITLWNRDLPADFDLPDWYFEKSEEIKAAQTQVDKTWEDYQDEVKSFNDLLNDPAYEKVKDVEIRLSEARAAYLVADEVLERSRNITGNEIKDSAQENFDLAKAELEAAQTSYDQLLTDKDYEDVLEARSRLAVARESYEVARDILDSLLTGENALSVKLAEQAVRVAEAQVTQAEAGITQVEKQIAASEKSLDLIDLNIEKLLVSAPVSGTLRTRSIEPGEILQAGISALVIDRLDQLTVTVYFPEDRYGQIKLGDVAEITVDSYPGETFEAEVIRISDRAEYTPRNVQTAEDRVTTVYAIELAVDDYDGKLKPGMPLDATFAE